VAGIGRSARRFAGQTVENEKSAVELLEVGHWRDHETGRELLGGRAFEWAIIIGLTLASRAQGAGMADQRKVEYVCTRFI